MQIVLHICINLFMYKHPMIISLSYVCTYLSMYVCTYANLHNVFVSYLYWQKQFDYMTNQTQ